MLKVVAGLPLLEHGARVLAGFVFLYFLSAFIQTGYVTPLQMLGGLLWLLLCYMLSRRLGIVTVLAASFAGSVLWGMLLESVPTWDSLTLNKAAYLISSGDFSELFKAKSPATAAYYAVFHRLLGSDHVVGYIASSAAWTAGAAFVYKAISPFVNDIRLAKFVSFGLALCPTFVTYASTPSSEPVFFLVSAICAWLISRHLHGSGPFPYLYVAIGLATAALFLTRTNGILALIVCLLIIAVGRQALVPKSVLASTANDDRTYKRRLVVCTLVAVSFISLWFAHGQLSSLGGHGFQVTPSPWGSLNLLVGTSFHADGRRNTSDLELAGYQGPNKLPFAEANENARKIASERILSDPVGFAEFALTDKVRHLWGKDYYLFAELVGLGERDSDLDRRIWSLVMSGRDSVYRVTFLLFLVFLLREVRRPTPLLALGVIPFLFSLPHILVEVMARYNLPMVPFIMVGSMLIVDDLWCRRSHWIAAVRRHGRTALANRSAKFWGPMYARPSANTWLLPFCCHRWTGAKYPLTPPPARRRLPAW